jgi:hypothetical protein
VDASLAETAEGIPFEDTEVGKLLSGKMFTSAFEESSFMSELYELLTLALEYDSYADMYQD